jgi:transposase
MFWSLTRSKRKKALLQKRLFALPLNAVVLFEDETSLLFFPPLQARWAKRGEPSFVRLSGWNHRRTVFGALNVKTGESLFRAYKRQRSEEFGAFLREVRKQYRSRQVVMVLDEASSHTSKASEALAGELKIELLWLPVRCPELNPLERIWRHAKARVCANYQYETIDGQSEVFLEHVSEAEPEELLQTSGVLCPDFWLFR